MGFFAKAFKRSNAPTPAPLKTALQQPQSRPDQQIGKSLQLVPHQQAVAPNPTHSYTQTIQCHALCVNCSTFFSKWPPSTGLPRAGSISKPKWTFSRLCSVSYLSANPDCHLCRGLLGTMYGVRDPKNLASGVFLSMEGGEKASPTGLAAVVAKKDPTKLFAGKNRGDVPLQFPYTSYAIQSYSLERSIGFQTHLTTTQLPLYARDNISCARNWINKCCSEHRSCHEFQDRAVDRSLRPSRLLEVTPTSARLVCDVANRKLDYLALSHMWGVNPEKQLRLLAENLRVFEKNIPWDQLSIIYKEAIRATCALGYKYVWIDSLSIIQDSKADWEFEAQRMGGIYANAVCTLAYVFPPNETQLLRPRDDPRTMGSCVVRPATASQDGIRINMLSRLTSDREWYNQEKWPLFSRGWTLQEYLLSPRTLILGHKHLMWQCSEIFYDEVLGPMTVKARADTLKPPHRENYSKLRYFPQSLSACIQARSFSDPQVLAFLQDWHRLIAEYRDRRLSHSKDRAIAFAGVASAFQRLGNMHYLAGLFFELLPLTLAWCVDSNAKFMHHAKRPEVPPPAASLTVIEEPVASAPSWSWFSAPIYANFQVHSLWHPPSRGIVDNELNARCLSNADNPTCTYEDFYWARPVGFRWPSLDPLQVPPTSLSDFIGLNVTLRMLCTPLNPHPVDIIYDQFIEFRQISPLDRKALLDPVFEYYPDDLRRIDPQKGAIMALLSERQSVRVGDTRGCVQRRLIGLMLKPGKVKGTYRRVGAWRLSLNSVDVKVEAHRVKDVTKRWKRFKAVDERFWHGENVVLV